MGSSHGSFVKYPRTPHLFGSSGTNDDRRLSQQGSARFLADESLIVEEKIDGTNVGIHFDDRGELILQCRGHLITEGMHPQYDLFKQWVAAKRYRLQETLGSQFIMFGEWVYAKHSVFYRQLPHFFFEFDVYDKFQELFIDLEERTALLQGTGILSVPIIHRGPISREELPTLVGMSAFDSQFDNPLTGTCDHLMEGVYLRTEADGAVTGRAKFVRPEFVEKIKQSNHWQHQAMIPNLLAKDADIWS